MHLNKRLLKLFFVSNHIKKCSYATSLQGRIKSVPKSSIRAVVPGLFPNAQIVIDRFHIIQLKTRSISAIRRGLKQIIDKQSREYKIMKNG